MSLQPELYNPNRPMVSVQIYNYNYGHFLKDCLDSVFSQTYNNIEISFSDNASEDDSWEIALEYVKKYPGVMTLTRNRNNFGSDANLINCRLNARGKYSIILCSDDMLRPGYVETCVCALESNPSAAFVMVNRTIIDEKGNRKEEPPFYNQSCVIPGEEQAAVYMMAPVNPSISQVMYNRLIFESNMVKGPLASRWYGPRLVDFIICCFNDIVYIKEPLLLHRLHSQNDSLLAADNLLEIIGTYVLQHQYADIASTYTNLDKAIERLPASIKKLSSTCMRYCLRSLVAGKDELGWRYYHLAVAISPSVTEEAVFKAIGKYWVSDEKGKMAILGTLKDESNLLTRAVSYDPPPGSKPL